MKRFLLLTFLFLTLFASVYALSIALYNRNNAEVFKIPEDRHILFLGNSHVETSINDSIIPGAYNFAHSAEDIVLAYTKLVMMKKYNPQIDMVVYGFDNVLNSGDKNFCSMGNSDYDVDALSPRLIGFMSIHDFYTLSKKYKSSYTFDNFIHLLDIVKLRTNINSQSISGYLYLKRDKLQSELDVTPERSLKAFADISSRNFDEIDYEYMDKIVDFCEKNSIKLIFIWVPQHKKSLLVKSNIEYIANKYYPNIEFHNFINMELPDSCFGDIDHLNYKGAKTFSKYIDSLGILK